MEVLLWPSGTTNERVWSWPHFLSFWKKNYLNIKVRKRGADTCSDCLMHLYTLNSTHPVVGRSNGEDEGEDKGEDKGEDNEEKEKRLKATIRRSTEKLALAKDHVRKYTVQRDLANRRMEIARLDVCLKMLYSFFCHCFTIDMG